MTTSSEAIVETVSSTVQRSVYATNAMDRPVPHPHVDLLWHALGVDERRRDPWRNHFVAGDGHHEEKGLHALVAEGMMAVGRRPSVLSGGDVVYVVTDLGRAHAIRHLPPEPVRTIYRDYLYSDTSRTFAEWLGIDPPRRETDRSGGLVRLVSPRGRGEWASTLKEAKASYKADMLRRRTEARAAA